MKQKYGYLIVFLIALVGCGGGGSSSKIPEQVNTAPQLVGLIDFAIDENTTAVVFSSIAKSIKPTSCGAVFTCSGILLLLPPPPHPTRAIKKTIRYPYFCFICIFIDYVLNID